MTQSESLHAARRAEASFRRGAARAEALREQRNAAVLGALKAGCTHAQVAEATGLSRGRIAQLAGRAR